MDELRREILLTGVRWTNNILVEILSKHARAVSNEGADSLAKAIQYLAEAERAFRRNK
jgi:hypothetical protein